MPAQNGITSDDTLSTEAPQAAVVNEAEQELKRAAGFVKTPEFAELKTHLESRIDFYKQYLPNGRNILDMTPQEQAELGTNWVIANAIIGECRSIINVYEMSAQQASERATGQV